MFKYTIKNAVNVTVTKYFTVIYYKFYSNLGCEEITLLQYIFLLCIILVEVHIAY